MVRAVDKADAIYADAFKRSIKSDSHLPFTILIAFVSSHVDYCNAVLAFTRKVTMVRTTTIAVARVKCPCGHWHQYEFDHRLLQLFHVNLFYRIVSYRIWLDGPK